MLLFKSKNFILMNNQITRRNLLKLLGVSGVTLPLTGISKELEIRPSSTIKNDGFIKLSSNENPYGPSPKVREAIINAFDEACRYPYNRVTELEEKIAEREGVDPSMVLVTGGSNEGLRATGRLFGVEKKEIIACKPTYLALMTYAEEFECKINWVPLDDNLRYDLNEISRRTSKNTSMVFICNPNNPTGTMLKADDLEDFCTATAKKTCVFVDEAYYDYSINDGYPTMTKLVKEGHNVIVSRTFSKIYGLAGVRIGYLIASSERIAELKKCTMAGTNMLATHAAMFAYDETSFFDYSLNKNKEALEIFYNVFDELKLDYVRSYTNFAFFKTGIHIDEFSKYMKENGILVGRPFPPYYDWCRISTGTSEEVDVFMKAMLEVYG